MREAGSRWAGGRGGQVYRTETRCSGTMRKDIRLLGACCLCCTSAFTNRHRTPVSGKGDRSTVSGLFNEGFGRLQRVNIVLVDSSIIAETAARGITPDGNERLTRVCCGAIAWTEALRKRLCAPCPHTKSLKPGLQEIWKRSVLGSCSM